MLRHRDLPRAFLSVAVLGLFVGPTTAAGENERKITKLADGVYEIQHAEESGNTTVIIGDRQVFVVDACFLPSAAREDIAQIRQWTDKPVSFVLNTHFHNDHNFGNRIYMDEFPAVTIIAHVETKKEMDLFGPGSEGREEKTRAYYNQMLKTGKTPDGTILSDADKAEVTAALAREEQVIEQFKKVKFQSATLTFDHDFMIDLGNRQVEIKFLGRGNTGGDAVVYLPKEKIVATGDLVVHPVPYIYDGYPTEWVETLQKLAQLDAEVIVPGHGPVLHDKTYIYLERDFLKSAVDQMNEQLRKIGPAMFHTLDDVKGGVDLSSFKQRFAGDDKDVSAAFDEAATNLTKVAYEEATLR
jgi:glyoxylase-like metal-dependent hydrolase (beta-lactamase superfamily II)